MGYLDADTCGRFGLLLVFVFDLVLLFVVVYLFVCFSLCVVRSFVCSFVS